MLRYMDLNKIIQHLARLAWKLMVPEAFKLWSNASARNTTVSLVI